MNTNIVVLVGILFILDAANCFAASPCEQIKAYYDKPPHEIKTVLDSLKADEVLDVKYYAERCIKESPFVTFVIAKDRDGRDKNADEAMMRESAQNILDMLDLKKDEQRQKETAGALNAFNFAAGLGMLYLNGRRSDIIGTTVDNNVLRITNEEKYKLGLWLSTHTYFDSGDWNLNMFGTNFDSLKFEMNGGNSRCSTNCYGLFAAAQLGGEGNSIVNAFSFGFAYAPTRKKIASSDKSSIGQSQLVFEIGWGATHIQTLADGYTNGMTLVGGNQPIMKRTIGHGPVIIVSYDID